MSAYEPGTVAVATVRGVPNVRVFRKEGAYAWCASDGLLVEKEVTDVRPLVVLDLGDNAAAYARDLLSVSLDRLPVGDPQAISVHAVGSAIEAQTRPPKPDEPTGLGAVVEDAEGHRWVRNPVSAHDDLPWWRADLDGPVAYGWLSAVRVLSPGVSDD